MATLQGEFHYPYVPDEEMELGKGQIIIQGNFYTATRNKSCIWNASHVTLARSPVILLVMTREYFLSLTSSAKLHSGTVYLPFKDQKRRCLDSYVRSYRLGCVLLDDGVFNKLLWQALCQAFRMNE